MKRKILALVSILLLFITFVHPKIGNAQSMKSYLVGFNNIVNESLISKHGGNVKEKYKSIPVVSAYLTDQAVQSLANDPNVSYIEEDAQVHSLGQEVPWGVPHIHADDVNQLGGTGSGVNIAVMDSGIDYTHQDLNVVGGATFVNGTLSYIDEYGHGTFVAGIVSALNNDLGVVGVASEANLYSIRVLDKYGNGNFSDVISGIEWAISNNIDIINMSFGSNIGSKSLKKAIDKAYNEGILMVAAVGNDGYSKKGNVNYPAKYKYVMGIGAIDQNNIIADFSSNGKEVDLVAPGVLVNSTYINGYAILNGTSMAAPYVTGVASLLMQLNPELSNIAIEEILNQSAEPLGDTDLYGNGLINALNAYQYSQNNVNKFK
ncbi:S8 family peptidase [Peribacillus asahii]|uniref:Prepro-subtilisin ALP I n=1 Tax=Peribacillus asahii TaxID=228899 RepID=A0A3T0KRJ6_9BACI|nr:S8 family peptidase [Peribacillus asahii]AZV43017.1 prepro-subtilisin ALP I [Peribacillus asahii]USK83147.1 S8 family peptidase [Peribacillus asahii]